MKIKLIQILTLPILLALPVSGTGPVLTTRQQTVRPLALPEDTQPIRPRDVVLYGVYGYSAWQFGPGADEGQRTDLMPAGYAGATNAARLLSFFSLTDIHITDKESTAEVPYMGWSAAFHVAGPGGLNLNAYSPIILSTTHVLDAAVKTINALHQQTPFNFGICLGDVANSTQFNELRWFIDVMDGQSITPSSGAHLGAGFIDYQKPYQAAGLDHSILWYQAIGNHDQAWMGTERVTDKVRAVQVGNTIINMDPNVFDVSATESNGMYMGVVDGTTPYGDVVKGGLTNAFPTPPTVAADSNRLSVVTATSLTATFIDEFFKTTSLPQGHGFNRANTGNTAACYSFVPLTNLPLKVIVLDDTCKTNSPTAGPVFYGGGWMDADRLAWLTNELQLGQDSNQLMILACHIPIKPQTDLFNTNSASPMFNDYQTETNLLATLHHYPNLLLVMAGHRHINTVTPQPSPDPAHPEYGFWEVESPSLRDFPQQFRTWTILRNSDNSISILTTDVDPVVEPGSPAAKSRGYAIGAARIFGAMTNSDITSHTYNAELVKQLTTNMQARIAGYGAPLPLLASPPVVENPLLQLDTPAVVVGGEPALFDVAAEGNALQYQWSFGDGGTSPWTNLSAATHTYAITNCGPHTATVSVTDGQRSASNNLAVIVACDLAITKLQIGLNFAKLNADSISLTAKLDLPGVTKVSQITGFPVVVNVGDVQVPFTLNKSGRGVSPNGSCGLVYTKPTKKLPAGSWTATISLSKGSWSEPLAAYDMLDATTAKSGWGVTVPVAILVGNEAFATEKPLNYIATAGKSGTAK